MTPKPCSACGAPRQALPVNGYCNPCRREYERHARHTQTHCPCGNPATPKGRYCTACNRRRQNRWIAQIAHCTRCGTPKSRRYRHQWCRRCNRLYHLKTTHPEGYALLVQLAQEHRR